MGTKTMVNGRRRDIGLGGYPNVGLADAREETAKLKNLIYKGISGGVGIPLTLALIGFGTFVVGALLG